MADAYVTTSLIAGSTASVTGVITTPALGSLLIVVIAGSVNNSASHTCSDNQGNVYVKDANQDNTSSAVGCSIWHGVVLATGGTFNVTLGDPTGTEVVGLITELSGMDLVTPTDGTGATTAPTSGTALTTPVKFNLNPDDIVMAALVNNGSTPAVSTPNNGFTRAGQETNGTNFMITESAYIQVKSPGAQQTTWTWTGAWFPVGVIMAYRAAQEVSPLPAPRPDQPSLVAVRTANVL